MVMMRFGGSSRMSLVKGSFSNKGKIPVDVEPLCSTLPTSLVPYDTSENEVLAAYAPDLKENTPIKSQNTESLNLGDNLVQTSL